MVEEDRLAKCEMTVVQPSQDDMEEPVMKKSIGKTARRFVTLAAAIAILSSMVIAASATGLLDTIIARLSPSADPGKAVGAVYGDAISTEKGEMFSAEGEPIPMPDMERVSVDPAEAEKLVGGYVSSVEGSIALAGNTITMKDFLMDKMGLGAITFTIENPAGVPYMEGSYGCISLGGAEGQKLREPSVVVKTEGGKNEEFADGYNFLIGKSKDGTKLEVVHYFGTSSQPVTGQPLYFRFYADPEQEAEIEITPLAYAPSVTLTAENGKNVTLSSQGISVEWGEKTELLTRNLTIHFADGTDYQVEGENVMNSVVGYWRSTLTDDGRTVSNDSLQYLFNRLIDPNEVTSVTIEYDWREYVAKEETGENTEETEHKADPGEQTVTTHHETVTYKP